MADTRPRLFLERGRYRQRRLVDAVRLLAVLGAFLWMIPLIWPLGDDPNVSVVPMSRALYYVFGVWLALICGAAVLSGRLRNAPDAGALDDKGAQ